MIRKPADRRHIRLARRARSLRGFVPSIQPLEPRQLMVGDVAVGDAGFEAPSVGAGNYAYTPTGSAWTFASDSGVTANDSGFTVGHEDAPEGAQVAFLQYAGSFSQSVSGWAAGTYAISFRAAQRFNSAQDFRVEVDGVVVDAFTPSGWTYESYTTDTFTVAAGPHVIAFVGLDSAGGDNTAFIDDVSVSLATQPVATATYVGTDTTTQGNWLGVYGAGGYVMADGESSLPAYAAVNVVGAGVDNYGTPGSDVRALQTADGSARQSWQWWNGAGAFSIDVDLTGGLEHKVSLYLLDYDRNARSEVIGLYDAATGVLLDQRSFSSFGDGKYVSWVVAGHTSLTVTLTGGANPVVAGLFFDPPDSPGGAPTSATYVGTDEATQGSWLGVYGASGYMTADAESSLPPRTQVQLVGAGPGVYATSTTDVRALQTADGATRQASLWYASSEFSINVSLTDGLAHKLSLYLADYDSTSRSEVIGLYDAATGDLLDERSLSSFHDGKYVSWVVVGHVSFRVTLTGGANPVVAGLFLDPAPEATTIPAAPTNVTAAALSDSAVQVTWTGSAGASGYTIERSFDGIYWGPVALIEDVFATSFTDTGLYDGTWYQYRVKAVNAMGESEASNSASTATRLSTPTNFTATFVSTSRIVLAWTDMSGAETGYLVEQSLNGVDWSQSVATGPYATGVALDGAFSPGATYYFRVRALNAESDSLTTSTSSVAPSAPTPPSGVAVTIQTSPTSSSNGSYSIRPSGARITWNASPAAEGYVIERSADQTTWVRAGAVDASSTSFDDPALPDPSSWYYRVTATNMWGDSPSSPSVAVTPIMWAPTQFVATMSNGGVGMAWADNSAINTQYYVERDYGNGWENVAQLGGNFSAWTDAWAIYIPYGTVINYRIRAYSPSFGYSGYAMTTATGLSVSNPSGQWSASTVTGQPVAISLAGTIGPVNGGIATPIGPRELVAGAQHGSLTISTDGYVYTPDEGFFGVDQFQYQQEFSTGGESTFVYHGQVAITVRPSVSVEILTDEDGYAEDEDDVLSSDSGYVYAEVAINGEPAQDGTIVKWSVTGSGPNLYFDSGFAATKDGFVANRLVAPNNYYAYDITVSVYAIASDGDLLYGLLSGYAGTATARVQTLPGPAASVSVVEVDDGRLPADGTSQTSITVEARDADGRLVADGTSVDWSFLGAGAVVSADEVTTAGRATAIVRSGIFAGTQRVAASIDGVEASTYVENLPLVVTLGITGNALLLDSNETQAVTATVTDADGQPVADGTPITWYTQKGSIAGQSVVTSGIATATLSGLKGWQAGGPGSIKAFVGSSVGSTRYLWVTQSSAITAVAKHPVIAGDATSDNTYHIDQVDGSSGNIKYYAGTDVAISLPGSPGAVVQVTVGGPGMQGADRLTVNGLAGTATITLDSEGRGSVRLQSTGGALNSGNGIMLPVTVEVLQSWWESFFTGLAPKTSFNVAIQPKEVIARTVDYVGHLGWSVLAGPGDSVDEIAADMGFSFIPVVGVYSDVRDAMGELVKLWPGGESPNWVAFTFAVGGIITEFTPADLAMDVAKAFVKVVKPSGPLLLGTLKHFKELGIEMVTTPQAFRQTVVTKFDGFLGWLSKMVPGPNLLVFEGTPYSKILDVVVEDAGEVPGLWLMSQRIDGFDDMIGGIASSQGIAAARRVDNLLSEGLDDVAKQLIADTGKLGVLAKAIAAGDWVQADVDEYLKIVKALGGESSFVKKFDEFADLPSSKFLLHRFDPEGEVVSHGIDKINDGALGELQAAAFKGREAVVDIAKNIRKDEATGQWVQTIAKRQTDVDVETATEVISVKNTNFRAEHATSVADEWEKIVEYAVQNGKTPKVMIPKVYEDAVNSRTFERAMSILNKRLDKGPYKGTVLQVEIFDPPVF